MAYCTQTDILKQISEAHLIQLTDDSGTGEIDTAIVNQAIADAEAEIDSYCGAVYNVPFQPVPAVIQKISVDIAIYGLFSRKEGMEDIRQKKYDSAIRLLKDIAKGLVTLGKVPGPEENPERRADVDIKSEGRRFSRKKMEGF